MLPTISVSSHVAHCMCSRSAGVLYCTSAAVGNSCVFPRDCSRGTKNQCRQLTTISRAWLPALIHHLTICHLTWEQILTGTAQHSYGVLLECVWGGGVWVGYVNCIGWAHCSIIPTSFSLSLCGDNPKYSHNILFVYNFYIIYKVFFFQNVYNELCPCVQFLVENIFL